MVDADRVDGRTARARHTRSAIVDACIQLVEEGNLRPSAPKVAERAGVSVRSVFQHFADIEGLFAAVGERVLSLLGPNAVPCRPDRPLDERIDAVVAGRAERLELITPLRRAAAVNAWSSPSAAGLLDAGHAVLRSGLEAAFAPELAAAGDEAPVLLDALDAAVSWPAWEQLRTLAGCDIDGAKAAMRLTLRRLLT